MNLKNFILTAVLSMAMIIAIPSFACSTNLGLVNNTNRQNQNQGQVQGQAQKQGQLQGQQQSANNDGNHQSVTMNTPRDYHNAPSIVGNLEMPNHFAKPEERPANIINLDELISLKPVWTRAELEDIAKNNMSLKVFAKAFNGKKVKLTNLVQTTDEDSFFNENRDPNESIIVVLGRPSNGKMTGMANVTGNGKDQNLETFAKAVLTAMDMKCDVYYISYHNFKLVTKGSSWGLGINGSSATMNGNTSSVGTFGLGYSAAQSGYFAYPYIQGYGYKIK